MKTLVTGIIVAMALPAAATITINTQYGVAFDSGGTPVPDGTLFVMVADDGDDTFGGGFGLGQSLSVSGDADSVFVTGQAISLGDSLGGDTVFAMGGFNGTGVGVLGVWSDTLNLTLGVNGVATNTDYAFFFFPGATFDGNDANPQIIGSQAGGLNAPADAGAGLGGMIFPADGGNVFQGAGNVDVGGAVPNAGFTSVNLVPEPSAAALGLIGFLGLLRRRR